MRCNGECMPLYRRGNDAYHGHFLSHHLDFWSPEMLECNDSRETRAIEQVPRIREAVDC